jgi:hypothetical protein
MKTLMVHAHGDSNSELIRVPSNVVLIALSDYSAFIADDIFSHNIWHFKMDPMHEKLCDWNGSHIALETALCAYLNDIYTITKLPRCGYESNSPMGVFFPGDVLHNMGFTFHSSTFAPGVYRLPLPDSKLCGWSKSDLQEFEPGDPEYHSAFHHLTHPKHNQLENLKDSLVPTSLQDIFNNIKDDDIHMVLVFACRTMKSPIASIATTPILLTPTSVPLIKNKLVALFKSISDYSDTEVYIHKKDAVELAKLLGRIHTTCPLYNSVNNDTKRQRLCIG